MTTLQAVAGVWLLAAAAVGWFVQRRISGLTRFERWVVALLVMAGATAIATFVRSIMLAPQDPWNACRLAVTVSLTHGYQLYYPPDSGPILNTIYTPLSALVYLPAAIAGNPTDSILIASSIAFLCYFVPAAVLVVAQQPRRDPLTLVCIACGLTLLINHTFLEFPLTDSAFLIRPDSSALGLGAAACATLMIGKPGTDWRPTVLAALFSVLSVSAKQVMVPLGPALVLWLLLAHGRRAALIYIGAGAVFSAIAAAVFAAAFGWEPMVFNAFRIPSRHVWLAAGHIGVARELARFCGMYVAVAVVAAATRWLPEPAADEKAPPPGPPNSLRGWIAEMPFLPVMTVGVFLLSTAILARVKFGGGMYNYGPPMYFLAIGAVGCLVGSARRLLAGGAGARRVACLAAALLVVLPAVAAVEKMSRNLRRLADAYDNPNQQAFDFDKAHPGLCYFPWSVLSTLQAEGRLDHFDYGLVDRRAARFYETPEHLAAHVPPGFRYICYPPNILTYNSRITFPEYDRPVEVDGLPDWECFERSGR